MKYVIWVALGVALVGFGYLMADEFNRAGVLSSKGYIESGSKFGIDIGMSRDAAARQLSDQGLEQVELTATQSCHGRSHGPDRYVELWYDRSWRRGTICLSSTGNRVASVSWVYNWAAP